MKTIQRIFPLLLVATLAGQAHSAVLDFNSHPSDFYTPIVDSGFQFDFTSSGWGVFGPSSGACCNLNYNGTTALFADGERNGLSGQVVMTKVGGGTFAVSALDAATYWTGSTGTVELIGALLGGGTVTTSLSIGSSWASFTLPSTFVGLTSLTFRDTQTAGFLVAPGFGLDNINTAVVPEPEAYALTFAGLLTVGALVRRRRVTA